MDGLVAQETADRGAQRKAETLQRRGRERKLDVGEVMLRDHGEPERVRHPLPVRLADGGESEHRLDQLLELACGADFTAKHELVFAGVPPLVRRTGIDDQRLAGARLDQFPADLRAERAADDLERLRLRRVRVRGRDEAARLAPELDQDVITAGLCGGPQERHPLFGDGVVERLAWFNHR